MYLIGAFAPLDHYTIPGRHVPKAWYRHWSSKGQIAIGHNSRSSRHEPGSPNTKPGKLLVKQAFCTGDNLKWRRLDTAQVRCKLDLRTLVLSYSDKMLWLC